MSLNFIHAADLHIDSPLRGLERYEGAPLEALQGATRRALVKLVDHCLERSVDLLVISGDLFDGNWKDMNTGLFVVHQMKRLGEMPVCILRGNHDAASRITRKLTWPENVRILSSQRPETIPFEDLGVAVHGQSFPQQKVTENLAASYPEPLPDLLNVGLLHTSLTGSPEHDSYAPARIDDLLQKGYDYWALGHIHHREILHKNPYVVFSGNTQGRHIKEPGAKGCYLVEAEGGDILSTRFLPTDSLRWMRTEVNLSTDHTVDDLYLAVAREFSSCRGESPDRLVALRVQVTGACVAHGFLQSRKGREEAIGEIRNLANDHDEGLWVEKIQFRTSPPLNLDELRKGRDLIGDLLALVASARSGSEAMEELFSDLASFEEKTGGELAAAGLDIEDPKAREAWLSASENLLMSLLAGEDE